VATSSKVQFKLVTLREKALAAIDNEIEQKEQELASLESDEVLAEQLREWRAQQEAKLSELFSQLDSIDDYRLSRFKLDPIPKVDRYEVDRARTSLERARTKRDRIVAKSDSLVGDEAGNISLTKTQLAEFFGL